MPGGRNPKDKACISRWRAHHHISLVARLDQESIRLLVFGLRMDSWDSRLVKSTLMVPGGYRRSGQAINEEEKIIFA